MTAHLAWDGDTDTACGLSFDAARKRGEVSFLAPEAASGTRCRECRKGALRIENVEPLGARQGLLFSAATEEVYPVDARNRGSRLQRARYAQNLLPDAAAKRLGLTAEEYLACEQGRKSFDVEVAELWMRCP